MLELRDVSKSFAGPHDAVHAVAGVRLEVRAGEFVAIRGPSGSGKSTLLLMAGGLLRPDTGSVALGGADVYALGNRARARLRASSVGFVFQQFHLVPYLSVLDNVRVAGLAVGGAPRSDAAQVLRSLGLGERLGHVPGELSAGEQQRAALARAVVNHPGLLLADEPTGNLDEGSAGVVLASLAAFARGGGAVLMVTHNAAAAARAERQVWLEHGRISDHQGRLV